MDYYDELGVTRSAADVDVKKACVPPAAQPSLYVLTPRLQAPSSTPKPSIPNPKP
jgi:hypothetical protein